MWSLLVPLWALALGGKVAFAQKLFECASQIPYADQLLRSYKIPSGYNKNNPPSEDTTVYVGVNVNSISGVDEKKEELTLDVFLQVSWKEPRLNIVPSSKEFIDLPWEFRQQIWMPDLYIWQLEKMRILSVLQDLASLRLYSSGNVSASIGASLTIKCDMEFVLYPLDVQNCAIDFSSYKYRVEEVHLEWREVTTWTGVELVQRTEFRLPKYVVTFITDKSEHAAARLQIRLSRELHVYLMESYLPSSLFVIMSWGSFCVIPEVVPGRMVLLVTTLLALVTMSGQVSLRSPQTLELKCIDVWMISCTFFVFLALLEYFVVLFGIRYDKCWSLRCVISRARVAPSINQQSRGFQGILFRLVSSMERGVMFCGAQHGSMDQYALMTFPVCFFLFVVVYWTIYLIKAHSVTDVIKF